MTSWAMTAAVFVDLASCMGCPFVNLGPIGRLGVQLPGWSWSHKWTEQRLIVQADL